MKIKSKLIFAGLVTCSCILGCSDIEFENPNEITQDTFWKNEDDANKGVLAVYDRLQPDMWGLRNQMFIRLNRSDEVIGDREEEADYSNFISWDGSGIWNPSYQGIFRANQVIDNVPGAEMDENNKKRIIAEAKFLRAYWYFDLLIYFENIVLITKVPVSEEDFFPPQVPSSEVWNQVVTDLTEAIPDLPETVGASEYGRATAIAANALLGKVYLYQKNYTSAETSFASVISNVGTPLSVLQPNFSDNFGGNEPEPNPEFLFAIRYDADESNGAEYSVRPYYFAPFAVSGWRLSLANPWLLTEMKKEKTAADEYDPRLLTTLLWNDPASGAYGKTFAEISDDPDQVYLKKWMRYNLSGEGGIYGSASDHPLIRYADVLLMQAEVKNELNKSSEAVALINEVRQRAQLVDFNSGSKQEIFDQIVHQRIMELAGEGQRFQDLKRWGMLSVIKEHDPNPAGNNITLPRDEVLAIPQSEIDTNPNVTQNEGF